MLILSPWYVIITTFELCTRFSFKQLELTIKVTKPELLASEKGHQKFPVILNSSSHPTPPHPHSHWLLCVSESALEKDLELLLS